MAEKQKRILRIAQDDNRKDKGKDRSGSFASLRMTTRGTKTEADPSLCSG
jgi:hypothetical protein